MAPSTHNPDLTSTATAAARRTHDGHRGSHSLAQTRDRVGTLADMALAERRRCRAFADDQARRRLPLARLSPLDREEVAEAAALCVQGGAQAASGVSDALERRHSARSAVAVHSSRRGRLEREHRQRLLRRLADDLGLGWRRTARPAEPVCADGVGGAAVSGERILDRVAGRAVAEHQPSLSQSRIAREREPKATDPAKAEVAPSRRALLAAEGAASRSDKTVSA